MEQFLRFANMKRDQHLKEVEVAVSDVTGYRLIEVRSWCNGHSHAGKGYVFLFVRLVYLQA